MTVALDPVLADNEPDAEVQALLRNSPGRNLGVDFLPGALDLDAGAFAVDAEFAGAVLWFDALIGNVDRSWRNPNLLLWHNRPYLIDHGAALTFHHRWSSADAAVERPYDARDHALLAARPDVDAVDERLAAGLDDAAVDAALADVPDEWLVGEEGFDSPGDVRDAYRTYLSRRVAARASWLPGLHAAVADGAVRTPRRSTRPGWLS